MWNFIKKRLQHKYFLMNFKKDLRTLFLRLFLCQLIRYSRTKKQGF